MFVNIFDESWQVEFTAKIIALFFIAESGLRAFSWLNRGPHEQGGPWRISVGNGGPWRAVAGHCGPWRAMVGHGRPWRFMAVHGEPWRSMASVGRQWLTMAGHGWPWRAMAGHALSSSLRGGRELKVSRWSGCGAVGCLAPRRHGESRRSIQGAARGRSGRNKMREDQAAT